MGAGVFGGGPGRDAHDIEGEVDDLLLGGRRTLEEAGGDAENAQRVVGHARCGEVVAELNELFVGVGRGQQPDLL
jgi:hypothetical protein